jgi:K+-transporting ATPase ATPase C chain
MKQLRITVLCLFLYTLFCGVIYPLTVTGIGYLFFRDKAGGSIIIKEGRVIGSELIGQLFIGPGFFHGRPSSVYYDSSSSGGSNLGQTNDKFISGIIKIAGINRNEYGMKNNEIIPSDLLFSSASGLDPHISVEAALLQCESIASARNINTDRIVALVGKYSERQLSYYGTRHVNVLKLNIELDGLEVKK